MFLVFIRMETFLLSFSILRNLEGSKYLAISGIKTVTSIHSTTVVIMDRVVGNDKRHIADCLFDTSSPVRYLSLTGVQTAEPWKTHIEFECYRKTDYNDQYERTMTVDKLVFLGTVVDGTPINRFEWNRYIEGKKVRGITLNQSEIMLVAHHLRKFRGLEYSMPAVKIELNGRSVTLVGNMLDFAICAGVELKSTTMKTKSHSQLLAMPRMIRSLDILINAHIHRDMIIWMTLSIAIYDTCLAHRSYTSQMTTDILVKLLDEQQTIYADFREKIKMLEKVNAFEISTQAIEEMVRQRNDQDLRVLCGYINERKELSKNQGILSEIVYLLFMLKRKQIIETRQ